jgi:hypothetical protein
MTARRTYVGEPRRKKLTDQQRQRAILALLRVDGDAIANALQVYARGMDEAASEAQAGYEAGQADAAVRAAQDATMLPNSGLREAANLFNANAAKARRIAAEIEYLTNDMYHEEDAEWTIDDPEDEQ